MRRLIDANALIADIEKRYCEPCKAEGKDYHEVACRACWVDDMRLEIEAAPTVEAEPVVHGRWVLTAHEEYANYRWNVTAECSECHHDKGEVYASFITGFPTDIARDIVLEHAESVKLDNYCPNCGAKMDGDGNV